MTLTNDEQFCHCHDPVVFGHRTDCAQGNQYSSDHRYHNPSLQKALDDAQQWWDKPLRDERGRVLRRQRSV